MKIDLFTKTVLTLIGIFLAMIALRPLVPGSVQAANDKFGHIQFAASGLHRVFFDQRTGDLFRLSYGISPPYTFTLEGKVEALGKFRHAE